MYIIFFLHKFKIQNPNSNIKQIWNNNKDLGLASYKQINNNMGNMKTHEDMPLCRE